MIDQELLIEIEEFCKLNELDVKVELNKALRGGFTTLKFGATPMSSKKEQKPVEVIKMVEKIVKVSDDIKVNELLEDNRKLIERLSHYKGLFKSAKGALKECKENNKKDIYGE